MNLDKFKIFFYYILFLLGLIFFVHDKTPILNPYKTTIYEMTQTSPSGDSRTFGKAALDIAQHGWLTKQNKWILRLWPPGFILLEAGIIKVFGESVPFILVLQILIALLFSFIMLFIYELFTDTVSEKLAIILPMSIFFLKLPRYFILQPYGIILGENFAIGFFLLGCITLIYSQKRKIIGPSYYAGAFFALSAYFRSQFEIFICVMLFLAIALIILFLLLRYLKKIDAYQNYSSLKAISISVIIALTLTIPWRVYNYMDRKTLNWVSTSNLTFKNLVRPTEEAGSLVKNGIGNLTCRIDPSTCGDYKNGKILTLKTFLHHMPEWYKIKLNAAVKFWFAPLYAPKSGTNQFKTSDYFENFLFFIMLIFSFTSIFFMKDLLGKIIFVWLNGSILLSHVAIFTLVHFEYRYFYFIKIYSIVIILIQMPLLLNKKNRKKEIESNNIVISSIK